MKVDRARFLMLTGAISGSIAAAACTINSTTNAGDGGAGSSQDASTGDSTTSNDSGTTTDTGASETSTDGGTEGGPDGATCDDTVGTQGACAAFDGGAADAGACLTDVLCTGILADLKPRVAQKAIDCITSLPTCESGAGIDTCIESALADACPDSTDKASCDSIAAICGDAGADAGVSQADCQTYAAGLTSDGRTKFVACMTESACFITDAKQCLQQL